MAGKKGQGKGHKKHGGRKKGTANHCDNPELQKALDEIDTLLARRGSSLFLIADALLSCGDPNVIARMWDKLWSYRYGLPKQQNEHTGKDGAPISIMNYIARPDRDGNPIVN